MSSSVDIPRAIDTAVRRSTEIVGTKPVSVVAEYPAHLPAVAGDQATVENVIASLVEGSVRVIDRGEIKVRAALLFGGGQPSEAETLSVLPEEMAEGGPWVLISVAELGLRGQGNQQRDVFAGPRPAPVEPTPGSAADQLDLETCRQLVQGFGGRLWSEFRPGGPSRVSFILPFQAASTSGPDVSSLHRTVASRLPSGAKTPHTLLLVVDNPELGDLLSRDLSNAGYGVMLAGNGSDGIVVARQTRPDLILLDLMVRQPPAFDFAMILRQDRRTRNIPVLFVTLVGDPKGEISVRAVNFLVRPAGTGALVSAINALLTSGVSPSARVLVVEPNDAVRDTLVMMIQTHGYRVTEATGSEETLALAERMTLGLILINAKLAQDRDFWLLRSLRQVSADTGIYVLADGLTEAEGRAAVRRGASGYSDTGKLPDLLDRVRNGNNGNNGS